MLSRLGFLPPKHEQYDSLHSSRCHWCIPKRVNPPQTPAVSSVFIWTTSTTLFAELYRHLFSAWLLEQLPTVVTAVAALLCCPDHHLHGHTKRPCHTCWDRGCHAQRMRNDKPSSCYLSLKKTSSKESYTRWRALYNCNVFPNIYLS